MEPSKKTIYTQLLEFQKKDIVIVKRGKGVVNGREYTYATLDDILAAVKPALLELGLFIVQIGEGDKLSTKIVFPNTKGEATVMTSTLPIGNPTGAQDLGARITYLRRYMLVSLLGLATEEDTDAGTGKPKEAFTPSVGAAMPPSMPSPATTIPTKQPDLDTFVSELTDGKEPAPQTNAPAAAPSAPAEAVTPPVQQTIMPQAQTISPAMDKAIKAIESCQSTPALKTLEGFVQGSQKITAPEKEELMRILTAKYTELNGAGK